MIMCRLLPLTTCVISLLCQSSTNAFQPPVTRAVVHVDTVDSHTISNLSSSVSDSSTALSSTRRDFFRNVATTTAALGVSLSTVGNPFPSSVAYAAGTSKVLVLGGTGFVGSRVVKRLQSMGITVTATSRDGRDGTIALDVTDSDVDVARTIEELSKGCTAVISTIGAIGTEQDLKVNSATGLAAMGAKAAGVNEFVYISVAPEVKEFAKDIDFLKPYLQGKAYSQESITSNFPSSSSTLIEPTFIYGGDSFNVNPPRVAGFYGEFIESLLSSGPIRAITNVAPEGFIKIALEPPVSVDAVADAAVAGALGKTNNALDTYDKIVAASKLI